MTIKPEIIGDKQHNSRAQYSGVACLYSQNLICSFLTKTNYRVLGQLLRFYLEHGMRLIKVHRTISFKFSFYVASYIANNTENRKQYKHDDVKKAFYKLMNNAPYKQTIETVARRTDSRMRNDMGKA